jgi:hypothetical protein
MITYPYFYKTVSDLIDSAQGRGDDIVNFVLKMSIDLDNSEILEGDLDRRRLDVQIGSTSTVLAERHEEYTNVMRNFVFNLQQYTEDSYGSVNGFLNDSGVQVKIIFADISEVVGYPIDSSNIEGLS